MPEKDHERVDGIAKNYDLPKMLNSYLSLLFCISTVCAFLTIFLHHFTEFFQDLIKAIFIWSVSFHFLISLVISNICLPYAERKRRKNLIGESFGHQISSEVTKNYYTNKEISLPIQKLALNVMENAFFSKNILAMMLKKSWVLFVMIISLWIIVGMFVESYDFFVITLQAVFSADFIGSLFRTQVLKNRYERVYENLYRHFSQGSSKANARDAYAISLFADYECAKANAGILLSVKNFEEEVNPKLKKEWEEEKKSLEKFK